MDVIQPRDITVIESIIDNEKRIRSVLKKLGDAVMKVAAKKRCSCL